MEKQILENLHLLETVRVLLKEEPKNLSVESFKRSKLVKRDKLERQLHSIG